jgi:hypothetical protein
MDARVVWVAAGGGGGFTGWGVESGAHAVGLVKHVGWLGPVGKHCDGLATTKELQCFQSQRQNLVGAVVRGLQSPACSVPTEKYMRAVMEVLLQE